MQATASVKTCGTRVMLFFEVWEGVGWKLGRPWSGSFFLAKSGQGEGGKKNPGFWVDVIMFMTPNYISTTKCIGIGIRPYWIHNSGI